MKKLLLSFIGLCLFGLAVWAAGTDNREALREYVNARKVVIADLKKTMDPEFMELNSQYNRARRFLRDTILARNPELSKIKDKAERNRAMLPALRKMRDGKEESYIKFRDARLNLENYLMTVNPELRETYKKVEEKLRDKWLNEEFR